MKKIGRLFLTGAMILSIIFVMPVPVQAQTDNADLTKISNFTIIYDGNMPDGSDFLKQENDGTTAVLSAEEPSRTGYVFQEWNTKADGTGISYQPGGTIQQLDSNLKLYAVWSLNDDNELTQHTIAAEYSDYTLSASGNLPKGSTIEVENVSSIEDIQNTIQKSASTDEYALIYFAYRISIKCHNGTNYQSDEPISLTVNGPIVRGDITGQLALYTGSSEKQMSIADASELAADTISFSFNGNTIAAVADITSEVKEYTVMPQNEQDNGNIEIENNNLTLGDNSITYAQPDQSSASKYVNPYLPALRDQGEYGVCWAHSVIALAELSAINNSSDPASLASTIDLSEVQLAYFDLNGTPGWYESGADVFGAATSMLHWVGPVNESDVPYSSMENVIANGLDSSYRISKDVYHVQNIMEFPISTDSERVKAKQCISENGGISISFCANNYSPFKYYSAANNAYYCPTKMKSNHAVTVVGWDDNFSASNFNYSSSIPSGNGAWLVRNSWGGSKNTDYCFEGYFWLSYYDQSIYTEAVALTVEDVNTCQNNYSKPENKTVVKEFVSNNGKAVAITAKAIGNANKLETLRAVSTGFIGASRNLKIEIYQDLSDMNNPTSGVLADTECVVSPYQSLVAENDMFTHGLLTVQLKNQSINIRDGTCFGMVVYLSSTSDGISDLDGFIAESDDSGYATAMYTSNTEPSKMQMYRLYNPNSGEHFYTASGGEKSSLVNVGWIYEGIGWTAINCSSTPVYRMYNPNAGDHHYTTNANEKDMLVKAGWIYEGIGWYSDDAKGVPLYRQYNPNAFSCNHNYTRNKSENDWLVSLGWNAEGISWYGCE